MISPSTVKSTLSFFIFLLLYIGALLFSSAFAVSTFSVSSFVTTSSLLSPSKVFSLVSLTSSFSSALVVSTAILVSSLLLSTFLLLSSFVLLSLDVLPSKSINPSSSTVFSFLLSILSLATSKYISTWPFSISALISSFILASAIGIIFVLLKFTVFCSTLNPNIIPNIPSAPSTIFTFVLLSQLKYFLLLRLILNLESLPTIYHPLLPLLLNNY